MLQDEGLLSVDDPVEKHLPEFKGLKTADGKPARVTIRHLLTHTSGMGEITGRTGARLSRPGRCHPPLRRQAGRIRAGLEMGLLPVGNQHRGADRRGGHGRPVRRVLKRRLFDPLGMKDTTFYLTEEQLPRLARIVSADRQGRARGDRRSAFLYGKSPTSRDRFPAAERRALFHRVGLLRAFAR